MKIIIADNSDAVLWNDFVIRHRRAAVCHRFEWRQVISNAYGHAAYYLMAVNENGGASGVLPLIHIRPPVFGNFLTSIPFFDTGGVLAADKRSSDMLLSEAAVIAGRIGAKHIELRNPEPLSDSSDHRDYSGWRSDSGVPVRKVRMLLNLPDSSDALMQSFKSKLRSQIRKPVKEGLTAAVGGIELLKAFYDIFAVNMRDLGSPVHSLGFIKEVLKAFPECARIMTVSYRGIPTACSLVIGFKDTLSNPWASSLKEYSRFSPNMLLYWTMLEYACEMGYRRFDFGRSTPDEGTYKFKAQWGAKPADMRWRFLFPSDRQQTPMLSDKSRFETLIRYWKKLPVSLTKIIGPRIRKYISL